MGAMTLIWLRDSPRKVQVTCFSHGCSAKDILESVGLGLSAMYYDKYDKSQYITAKNKGRLTPEELDYEIAIIDTHAKDLASPLATITSFDVRLVKVAKARLQRHYAQKQEVSQ